MNEHISESAALYALGLLEPPETDAIDAHVAACEACSQALAQAYDDVAAAASAQPQYAAPASLDARVGSLWTPPKKHGWSLRQLGAIAALLAIALLPTAYLLHQEQTMHRAMLADAGLFARMASSPHRMVAFTGGADAKVVYGNDGSWYGVIVRGATRPLRLVWMHDGQRTMLGRVQSRGDLAMIYLPESHRMEHLALADGDRVVAEAKLAF